jgi:CBS domain-containing protein
MTHRIAKLELDDKVGTAAEIFLENRFHALPIVDENDHLLGIVTTFDVLKYEFEKEYPKERTFTQ